MYRFTRLILSGLLLVGIAQAAETRTWTSRKGSNLEAQLLRVDGQNVVLLTPESKELKLKVEDLSLADRQYLVEYGNADPKVIEGGDLGAPENDVRIDSKTFRKLDEPLKFGDGELLQFDVLETEHFLIASDGVRPQPTAETAERMWHGMAFEHMNFRKDWGDKRRLILLVEDREIYTALGKWYEELVIAERGGQEAAQRIGATWEKIGATEMGLNDDLMKEWNLHDSATLFNVKEDRGYKKPMSPFPVHVIAGDLLGQQMGGVSNYGANGYFAVLTGFAYFKEIKLTKKTETHLIDAQGSAFDEITEKKGFDDGTSWAKSLRTLVKRGKIKPDFPAMMTWKITQLDPEKLVLIYSFAHYCNSNPKRLAGFANMVRRVESSNQIPEPIEFARLMGFDSVDALQKDWIEFISSPDFK